MKAIVLREYGSTDLLRIEDVERPVPKEDEVLIRVLAAAVNDYDWSMVRGKPYLYRLMYGLTRPRNKIPGMEVSGVVESLGPEVRAFDEGDEVFGDTSEYGFGCLAEYVAISEKALTRKPGKMSFVEAASIPHATMLALQGLRDLGKIRKNQKILINGAGGGVGTFGLQIAKRLAAEVTGVDTGPKLEMMREIGFDHVIDYREEDFTRNGEKYDIVLDTKTTRGPSAYLRALSPAGSYVTVGGSLSRLFQAFVLGPALTVGTPKSMRILALKPNKGIEYAVELFEEGKLRCVIDGPYSLAEAPKAIRHFGEGRHFGKVVIDLERVDRA